MAPGPLGALLPRIAHHIAHTPIRARGTFGGSLAHADPASEWCATAPPTTRSATTAMASA
ncbi:MAG TPA: FAD binding domain-containing protein [Crenalkalicoccus sp.]|nr:FAD binding domain-containing protein [Crenalkalicoccus sp.]